VPAGANGEICCADNIGNIPFKVFKCNAPTGIPNLDIYIYIIIDKN